MAKIINGDKNFCKLKESITVVKSHRRDIERKKLIEKGKRMGTDEIDKQDEELKWIKETKWVK